MLASAQSRNRSWESRMLGMADRLFTEFDALPIVTVCRAIGEARSELRAQTGTMATPEQIEVVARRRLQAEVG